MKTNYIDKVPKRCETCKHFHLEYGFALCMEGADAVPPTGDYVSSTDPIGFASIHREEEADAYRKFRTDRKINKYGVCDDYVVS